MTRLYGNHDSQPKRVRHRRGTRQRNDVRKRLAKKREFRYKPGTPVKVSPRGR